MSEIRKSVINFPSSNDTDTVAGYFYVSTEEKPKAILQISHGMCEYIERYEDFAEFMARNGYVVCGNDHLGHGATSGSGIDGYFGEKDGRKYVLRDLHRMNSLACKEYPGLPVVLLGHSMGSFFARMYAVTYPETLDALAIVGTGGPMAAAGFGIFLTEILTKVRGAKFRSQLINNLAFGQYLKKIESPATPYDWITRDTEIVKKYADDPKCTFIFTVSAFHELMCMTRDVNRKQWAQKIDPRLPVALFSGDMDPVGDYGSGVRKVYQMLKQAGVQDVELHLYPEARHEVLNETNRDEVYQEILNWCDAKLSDRTVR